MKKESQTQVFSFEFCEISKNTFFTEHFRWLLLTEAKRSMTFESSHQDISLSKPIYKQMRYTPYSLRFQKNNFLESSS